MSLARLLQLASPTLPVGAYSYSQGLEAAIEAGAVSDTPSAERWIGDVLQFAIATMDAPLLYRMMSEFDEIGRLNDLYLATRETAELLAETKQMGGSLCGLLSGLGIEDGFPEVISFPAAYALAATHWRIPAREAVVAYLWSWLENQVMAAVKAVPLGQTAGQKILLELGARLDGIADRAGRTPEEEWSNLAPGLAVLSSRHETQYSRLFRS